MAKTPTSRQSLRPTSAKSRPSSASGRSSELPAKKRPGLKRKMTSQLPGGSEEMAGAAQLAMIVKNWEQEFCIRVLCEHEEVGIRIVQTSLI